MVLIKKYFCFELITAGLVIGWIGFVNSTFSSASIITMLSDPDHYINTTSLINDFGPSDMEFSKSAFINILATSLAFAIINLLSSLALIVGTVKRNHLMLIPYLINNGFHLLYATLLIGGLTIYFARSNMELSYILLFFSIASLTIIFAFYTWAAIYSLYKKLKTEFLPAFERQRLLQQQKNYNTNYA